VAVSRNSKTKNSKSEKRQKVMFVVSTHWDREWYMPFQDFRYRLVKLMDEVLDILESDKRFTCFQMDGQTSPILDYLEIRPENEERIKKLSGAGRLAIGPWLTMPDEFIVSAESLVRNIQEGLRLASRFGEPSRAGFICDIFGHNSQTPQIFNGFGMKSAFLWRGINEENSGPYFRWSSPDGSELACYRLGPGIGYCNFPIRARNPQDHSEEFDINIMVARVKEYLKDQVERCGSLPVIFFDGADHLEIEPRTSELVEILNADKSLKKYEFEIAGLDSYGAELLKNRSKLKKKLSGELREPRRPLKTDENWMIPGVLSSRIPLKQANARCETLMTLWAEPFSRFAAGSGLEYPLGFLRAAWNNILLNHAHDSICGCSIDQVHKDMEYRYDQAEMIGERLKKAALDSIAESVARGMRKKYGRKILMSRLILPLPFRRTRLSLLSSSDLSPSPASASKMNQGKR
jgi:glycosyl hydrolase family 38/alpha mannosidase-like protein